MKAIITARGEPDPWETQWTYCRIIKGNTGIELDHDDVIALLETLKGERAVFTGPCGKDEWHPEWVIFHSENK